MYTWGANNQGQLGHPNIKHVLAVPTIVEFKRESQEIIRLNINKVQCGYDFTICRTGINHLYLHPSNRKLSHCHLLTYLIFCSDTNNLWVCGSNTYGQLGFDQEFCFSVREFLLINTSEINEPIKDFKCRERATCIYTE